MSIRLDLNQWTRAQKALVAASLVFVAIFVGGLIFPPADEEARKLFFNIGQIVTPLVGAIWALKSACWRAESSPRSRFAWQLIVISVACYAIGQIVWTFTECVLKIEAPFPSWADVFWVMQAVLLNIGIYLLFGAARATDRARLLLDSAIVTSSFAALIWYFVIGRAWSQSDAPLFTKVLGALYPICDIIALFGAIVLINSTRSDAALRCRVGLLAVGALLVAGADVGFNLYTIEELYQTGSWPDAGWTIGYLLIGIACLLPQLWPQFAQVASANELSRTITAPLTHEMQSSSSMVRGAVLPYVGVVAAFSLIAIQDYRTTDGLLSNSVFVIGLALIVLVIARQVFTLLENQHTLMANVQLTQQLQQFNDTLENAVAQRTAQLAALHEITRAVNNTLDRDQILSTATSLLPRALPADGFMLRLCDDAEGRPFQWCAGLENRPFVFDRLGERLTGNASEVVVLSQGAAYLRAPLSWQGQTTGEIVVVRDNGLFGPTEPPMLESIGLAIGTALENARRFTVVSQAEQSIKTSLGEKEVLLKEIHHRVKNNMQVISSMLNMQSDSLGDPQVIEMFRDSQNRIKSMALIHERLYQTADLAHVDFGEYLRNLTTNLMRSYRVGAVALKIETEPVALDIDSAVPCGLIVNELVSNALKHAWKGNPQMYDDDYEATLRVELHRLPDGGAQLQVSDNGRGFPADVDFRDTESLGLQLVTTLSEQVDGSVELERNPDGRCGTRWTITLPETMD